MIEMKDKKYVLYMLILLILLSLVIIILLADQNQNIYNILSQQTPLKLGEKAFIFAEETIAGEQIDIKDKRTLLFFFSRDCPGCTKFMPILKEHINNGNLNKIYLVAISEDNENMTKKFIAELNLGVHVVVDKNFQIARKYHIHFVPSLVLIDNSGKIEYFQHAEEKIIDALEKILVMTNTPH